MSYFRLYPTKNNTIFKYLQKVDANTVLDVAWSKEINSGANPIMELMDGKGVSKLLFSFDIPAWLKTKIETYSYTANLRLYDAGTLFQPGIRLKNVKLSVFADDFAEGDGYSFLKGKAFKGLSNWVYRQDGYEWKDVIFNEITQYHLNTVNEDLLFNVTASINTFLAGDNTSPKYALEIANHVTDLQQYTKFIHSKYTRTVFKPYIEFIINDEIKDTHNNLLAGSPQRLYLLNQTYQNFVGTLTAQVKFDDLTTLTPAIVNPDTGIYYIDITAPVPKNNLKDEFVEVKWFINDQLQYKELVKVLSPNQIFTKKEYDVKNLYFYPTTAYTHNVVRQGDIMPFDVISEVRGFGKVIDNNYEYKVVSADGFEMVPWTPVSVYKENLFFMVDTSYFFPEGTYEVILRNKTNTYSRSSHQTYKFKLQQDAQSHLRELSANPYYSRNYFFSK